MLGARQRRACRQADADVAQQFTATVAVEVVVVGAQTRLQRNRDADFLLPPRPAPGRLQAQLPVAVVRAFFVPRLPDELGVGTQNEGRGRPGLAPKSCQVVADFQAQL